MSWWKETKGSFVSLSLPRFFHAPEAAIRRALRAPAAAVMLVSLCIAAEACGKAGSKQGFSAGDTDEAGDTTTSGTPTDTLPSEPATCHGICVAVPPATYTGPSLFSFSLPWLVPPCPLELAPYIGIQGDVPGAMTPIRARECRITPAPTCPTQGQTCSPLPPSDFRVCIHHDFERPCDTTGDYTERVTMLQDETTAIVTVCCMKTIGPG